MVHDALQILEHIKNNDEEVKRQRLHISSDATSTATATLKASYVASLSIAQNYRPLSDGIFVKKICKEIVSCFGERGNMCVDFIEDIPLSRNTVTRRIEDLNKYLDTLLKQKFKSCTFFSLALDESCDISDISQLILTCRTVDDSFNVSEEVLALIPLQRNTRGVDIYNAINGRLQLNTELKRLTAVCTDGAPAMLGKNHGFIGQLLKNGIQVPSFHCIIHQESLCAKWTNSVHTMNIVVKVVNRIRGGHNALTHRKFKTFLQECEHQYGDLLMFTEVRWLSRGKCLERFFQLRMEIVEFIELELTDIDILNEIKSQEFNINLGFLTDLSTHLNCLNISLQGKTKCIFDLVHIIDGFIKKIDLLIIDLNINKLYYFPCLKTVFYDFKILAFNFSKFISHIKDLKKNFEKRFKDFKCIKQMMAIYYTPMTCSISDQKQDLQFELCDLQCDPQLKMSGLEGVDFWKSVNGDMYPLLKKEILRLYSMFGSTYTCESAFSNLKFIKNKHRNRLSNEHLEALLKLTTTDIQINVDKLLENESVT